MLLPNLLTVVVMIIMAVCYMMFIYNKTVAVMGAKKSQVSWLNLGILLMVGLIVRFILAKIESGYEVDMNCFSAWSDMVYRDGFKNFYTSDVFTDYPPGYMYILWVVGLFRHLFPSLSGSYVIVKMPAIICDLLTGALIYKVAHKRFDETSSILFSAFYLFNPVILIDSAMWGQVDSVFTFFIAVMVYLVAEKKLIPAYFLFAISILVKPQALILTPVLGIGFLDQVIFKDFDIVKFLKHVGAGLLAVLCAVLAVLPYGLKPVWEQYQSTLSSYPYATVNAYNFWGMFGLNWHSQEETAMGLPYSTWGTLFIVLLCVAMLTFCILNRHKENGSKYFFLGAFIVAGFFTMSVRVHERYMYPVFVMLMLAFLYKPRKEYIIAYVGLVLAQVNNIWHAFKYYDATNFDWEAKFPRWIGFFHVVLFGYIVYIAVKQFVLERNLSEEAEEKQLAASAKQQDTAGTAASKGVNGFFKKWFDWSPKASAPALKFTKFDWIAMLIITVIYGGIALFNLGNMDAPQTYWETYTDSDCIYLDFTNKTSDLTKLAYFDGRYECQNFYLEESADNVNWTSVSVGGQDLASLGEEASKFSMNSVFCWGSTTFTITQPYVRIRCESRNPAATGEPNNVINELVFFDATGQMVIPANADQYANLFDEYDQYPKDGITTFHDSTYFDEIYHGRTAYEMTLGAYNYEWTHPPLGKFIISIGIRIFGMCPFGWRIMGTLFGIAMLPIFFLFTKRIFRETWIATVTTCLLAADFMHFTQTRIATIDVFVTFFIILMYYFMFKYAQMSFNDTPLKKTFVPLLFCGIAMGLGCASKWTGVYAGLGLAVIFFAVIGMRYLEYRHACLDPKGESNGIKHMDVVNNFKKNVLLTLGFCILAFVIIPVIIFTLSYIPFDNGQDMGLIQRMIKNQMDMWNYHSKLDATHPFSSTWYEWIYMRRPIWYYNATVGEGIQENISAFGNPLVWWAGVPAFLYMLYRSAKFKDHTSIFLSISYLAQLVPWMGVTRCTFIYHYFPSVPFITLMVGYTMYCIYKDGKWKNAVARRNVKVCCYVYVAIAIGLFVMFYPVISGYPVSVTYVSKFLKWFSTWQLASV